MGTVFYLAKQNLKQNRFRTMIMILSVVLAAGTLLAAVVLARGVQSTLDVVRQRLGADIVVVPKGQVENAKGALISGVPTTFFMEQKVEQAVKSVSGVESTSPQIYLRSLDSPCCIALVHLVGYNPESDFTVKPWLLNNLKAPLDPSQIIVGAKVISSVVGVPTKAIGQTLVFLGKPFTVAGILDPNGLGTDFTVFMPMESARKLAEGSPLYPVAVRPDQISTVLVKTVPGVNPAEVAKRIEKSVSEVDVITSVDLTQNLARDLSRLTNILKLVGGILGMIALFLVGILFTFSAWQRRREFGLLQAMGASRRFVFRLILLESVLITGSGGLLGLVATGTGLYFGRSFLSRLLGNLYIWPKLSYFIWAVGTGFLVTVVVGILGGFYAAWRLSRLEPMEAIGGGKAQ